MLILIFQNDLKTVKNTHVLIDCNGETAGNYVKLHLFDVDLKESRLHESDYTCPGQVITPPVETPVGRIGLSIVSFILLPIFFKKFIWHKHGMPWFQDNFFFFKLILFLYQFLN